jgi:hypothetical protein
MGFLPDLLHHKLRVNRFAKKKKTVGRLPVFVFYNCVGTGKKSGILLLTSRIDPGPRKHLAYNSYEPRKVYPEGPFQDVRECRISC